MSTSVPRSLRMRLILGAAIGIVIGISAAGLFIAALFRQYATDLVDTELVDHLEELITLIDLNAEGAPLLYRPLADPSYSQPGSGFFWQVSRAGKVLIKSTSISTVDLPVPGDGLQTDEIVKHMLNGPHGPMIVFEELYPHSGVDPPLCLQIGVESAVVERMLPTFYSPLIVSLVLLAAALIAAAALQVAFGLKPMTRLRHALGAIGSGDTKTLPRDFPAEVQPLVDDLNNLIEVNARMVLRARTQAGNLAHALKTPLAVLTDEAQRLASHGQDDSAQVILQQSQRMQRQIDFQLARARAAASRSVPGVVAPVAPTVANIVSAMQRLYAAKALQFHTDIDPRCIALCDPMDLNEMTANLIDNACKWGSRAVFIRGAVDQTAKQVVVSVRDDGPGLPAHAMDVVFQIGERLDERMPGSGLGLPIVRDLARLYGGEIQLEHPQEGGLAAVLRLPWAGPTP
jgi:signal transduction histidine kinase